MVKIELTDDDALKFRDFMQHYDKYTVLKENGIFDMKNGSTTIHYDDHGVIRKIEKDIVAYMILTR